ncbi:MAG: class I SAM-dependent methyltransferase [Methanomicrobiaceae archaeon]|nr:class I SAM-dependent methyltransferase [Methanomicrobiaceae archaeon]
MPESCSRWESHYKKHRRPWAGAIRDRPKLPADLNVLEAGCGNGKHLGELLYSDVHTTAFDFSANAVAACKKGISCRDDKNRAELLVADCRYLPFRNSTFDIAYYRHVTGHMACEDRQISAEECIRVLKEKGELHFTGFSVEDMRAGKGDEIENKSYMRGSGIITHYFTEEEVRKLFSGLHEISLRTVRWKMRIRGKDYMRAEIAAVFRKVTR